MTTNIVDIERMWVKKYGATQTRKMMAGAHPPFAAYDARTGLTRRLGRDQEEPDDNTGGGDLIASVRVFLQNRLSPADFARLEQMLSGGQEAGEAEPPDDSGSMHGRDEPEDFPGKPRPGGRPDTLSNKGPTVPSEVHAQDSRSGRGGGYYDNFPGNSKVGTTNYGG